ncbi:MAG TPA: hypothetical protein VK203_25375, partial [Nostocaceae cyanobacterium]|nr:hypothetical protein [Nostocaceae cyanobacterium]
FRSQESGVRVVIIQRIEISHIWPKSFSLILQFSLILNSGFWILNPYYKFTLLLRDKVDYLTDRYSERQEKNAQATMQIATQALKS